MKKVFRIFSNVKAEQEWLRRQKGWKLIDTNGYRYIFEESPYEYQYEYIYFDKSKQELTQIKNQITDLEIEYVCHTSSWVLFRKEVNKGELHVFNDNYDKYKMLMKKYNTYLSLGACYICLGSSQTVFATTMNGWFGLASVFFYLASSLFYLTASFFKKYANEYDDGTYAKRIKNKNN